MFGEKLRLAKISTPSRRAFFNLFTITSKIFEPSKLWPKETSDILGVRMKQLTL